MKFSASLFMTLFVICISEKQKQSFADVLKDVAMLTWKHLCWSLFLINMQAPRPATLFKRDSSIGAFEISQIFKNTSFYRAHPVAASGNIAWTFSLLDLRTMNSVILWYVLDPQRLFHFIACVSFLLISFCFSYFF